METNQTYMQSEKSSGDGAIFLPVMVLSVLVFVLFYPPLSWSATLPASFWIKQVFSVIIMGSAFYMNANYVAPRLLLSKNRKFKFTVWFLVATAVILILARIIEINLGWWAHMTLSNSGKEKSVFSVDNHLVVVSLMVLMGSTGFAGVKRWQQDAVLHEVNQKQQIASELALLKAQINPHFFFNTLNNIYALTYSDIPLSRDALLKLSRMMRYVLYETVSDKSLVSKEMDFIQDYIELMTIRVPECTSVVYKEERLSQEYLIAPMLLLPFIENAFKYGVNSVEKSRIEIKLGVEGDRLCLEIFNQVNQDRDTLNMDQKGIGLANTKKRLDLLYPNQYKLDIHENEEEKSYHIMLKMNLENLLVQAD